MVEIPTLLTAPLYKLSSSALTTLKDPPYAKNDEATSHVSNCLSILLGFPKVFNKSFSLAITVGNSTGPCAKGPTSPPTLPDVGSTLPTVKSTSFTTMPGDARFIGILIPLVIQIYSKNIY